MSKLTISVDTDKVKRRNEELMKNKWIDKLTSAQKKLLNWRKGPPQIMNRDGLFGYQDMSNYLLYPDKFSEININNLREYLSIYEVKQKHSIISLHTINEDLKKLLETIQKNRINKIQKYIMIEDSIFAKGIYANDIIYRVTNDPIDGNIIKHSTSWSLAPIYDFCYKKQCHLYVTKIPKKLKVLYLENTSKDKNLHVFQEFWTYEFEFVLPRNLEYKEIRTNTMIIPNRGFNSKNPEYNFKDKTFIVHYIRIIKKLKHMDFPKINNIKLVSDMNQTK